MVLFSTGIIFLVIFGFPELGGLYSFSVLLTKRPRDSYFDNFYKFLSYVYIHGIYNMLKTLCKDFFVQDKHPIPRYLIPKGIKFLEKIFWT